MDLGKIYMYIVSQQHIRENQTHKEEEEEEEEDKNGK